MPPVINPETASSIQSDMGDRGSERVDGPGRKSARGRRITQRLLPGLLGEERRAGRAVRRPDHLELATRPLADDARRGNVLAVLEADLPDDGVELVVGDVVAERLAVEPDFRDRLLEDLEARPSVRARPPIGLLLPARDVRVEIGLRRRA